MNRLSVFDSGYGVFVAGPPRLVRTWFRGAFYEVIARDIGRAPQPGYAGTGDACEGPTEPAPKPKRVGGRKALPLDEKIQRRIQSHYGSMQLGRLAIYVKMPVADLWRYLAERPETYKLTGKLGKRNNAPRVALRTTNFQEDHK